MSDITTDCIRHTSFKIQPAYQSMVKCEDRIQTFKDWPQQVRQTPHELASNGFFYSGQSDKVTCFMCGVHLSSWTISDFVDIEHKRWSKDCVYLLMTLPK